MDNRNSIEWLEHKLNSVKPTDFCSIETIKEWLIEAKQMHKEEIKSAFNNGMVNSVEWFIDGITEEAETYYNEIYKGGQNG